MRSKVWKHFKKLSSTEATCGMCHKLVKVAGGTTNLHSHLKNRHWSVFLTLSDVKPQINSKKLQQNIATDLKNTPTRSKVWKYFTKTSDTEATCTECFKTVKVAGGTTNLHGHLKRKHFALFGALNKPDDLSKSLLLNEHQILPSKTSREVLRSEVWNYFIKESKIEATCKLCHRLIKVAGGTTNLHSHLKNNHLNIFKTLSNFRISSKASERVQSESKNTALRSVQERNGTTYDEDPQTNVSKQIKSYKFQHYNHESRLLDVLSKDELFVDVTLTAQGRAIKAHKLVLSAMSPYFQRVLGDNLCQHPIIVMPREVSFDELKRLVTFIYKGELSTSSDELLSLVKTARLLEITGLIDIDIEKLESPHSTEITCTLSKDNSFEGTDFQDSSMTKESESQEDTDEATTIDVVNGEEEELFVRQSLNLHHCTPKRKKIKLETVDILEEMPPDKLVTPTDACIPCNPPRKAPQTNEDTTKHIYISSVSSLSSSSITNESISLEEKIVSDNFPELSQTDHCDPVRLFMCDCGIVFLQQSLLDHHKKQGCSSSKSGN